MKRLLQKIIMSIGIFLSVLTLGSQLGRFHWSLDVLSHYHLQYTVGLVLCMLTLLLWRNFRAVIGLLVALIANLALVAPFFLSPPAPTTQAAAEGPPLRVMAMNISTSNAGYGQVVDLIRARQPDLVFMSEVREDLLVVLREQLADSYPYLHAEPSRITLGVAFLSRQPFLAVETVMPGGERGRRYLRAVLAWQGQPVTIVGIHPLPPMSAEWAASRNSEIALMGKVANGATQPFILLGDLNASPWSQPMRQLLTTTDLRYAMQGYGVGLTWRLAGMLLGAPLDYILVSPAWHVVDYVEGGDIRSDHIPIQADLLLGQG